MKVVPREPARAKSRPARLAGLGYSIYRQFATSTPRFNAFDFAAAHCGACARASCGGDKETPEHIIRSCFSPPLTAARAAFLACCGHPAGYQISHEPTNREP